MNKEKKNDKTKQIKDNNNSKTKEKLCKNHNS